MKPASIKQWPNPGKRCIFREGDFFRMELKFNADFNGKAFVRTSLFNPLKKQREIIEKADRNQPRRFGEWGDIPMVQKEARHFTLEIPLHHVGYFEAKAFLLEPDQQEPIWPEGENVYIKVEPADTEIANSIYSAFIRLFTEDSHIKKIQDAVRNYSKTEHTLFNLIPETGKFRQLIKKIDFITDELGFDIIMLLPVHPVPTTYARMGLLGSPFASLDYMNVDRALADFDKRTTPMEQFSELIDAVHAKHARIFMDIPINHTGWASQLQIHHPEYFVKDTEGMFISPGAWGVTWSDLAQLDHNKKGLWDYFAQVFRFWCYKGIDGFRCDAGYMIPADAWEYITARVRSEFPHTIFLLEGLGGKLSITKKLLTTSNLNWAYSELFQNFTQEEIEWYTENFKDLSYQCGPLINFSETHDNNRLASVSKKFSRLRNGITALFSDTGTYAITCGVEWYADEKIDVHRMTSLKWGNPENQVRFIKRLNDIIKSHPTFLPGGKLKKVHNSHLNSIAYLREIDNYEDKLLIVANLSDKNNQVILNRELIEKSSLNKKDLLNESSPVTEDHREGYLMKLEPFQIALFSNTQSYTDNIADKNIASHASKKKSERILKLQIIKLFAHIKYNITEELISKETEYFEKEPLTFFSRHYHDKPTVIRWEYPQDLRREFMIPEETPVVLFIPHYFRFKVMNRDFVVETGEGFHLSNRGYVAILHPGIFSNKQIHYQMALEIYNGKKVLRNIAHLTYLQPHLIRQLKNFFRTSGRSSKINLSSISVNDKSGTSIARGAFSEIRSKYDALLAANINPTLPEDNVVMLTRFRGWAVFRGFSREIGPEYQMSFAHFKNTSEYYFEIPAGSGLYIPLKITLNFHTHNNQLNYLVQRVRAAGLPTPESEAEVTIILRPDIENRVHHEVTKAYQGPEQKFLQQTKASNNGFLFGDQEKKLSIAGEGIKFVWEPEWTYNVVYPTEHERGLEARGDLFSPGYFTFRLKENEKRTLLANVNEKQEEATEIPEMERLNAPTPAMVNIKEIVRMAVRKFIVNRYGHKTVIAGYPWFLDWGRDTLICLRGIIHAGFLREAKEIIMEFASFEEKGTLPNVIRGADTSNRDTSDAPLWLFVAIQEYQKVTGEEISLEPVKEVLLKDILKSIAAHYIKGTPNGIQMDEESGLIYSPAHFTWMDTNYPAGTPRQGYPIEIQALWYAALEFMHELFPGEKEWKTRSQLTKKSIKELFICEKEDPGPYQNKLRFLSDCLHSKYFQPAKEAIRDDHLRPNQLFVLTLGALEDQTMSEDILSACEELLIPGAIRTLADRDTEFPLQIKLNNEILNNPHHPYQGKYSGEEDHFRKPAYHNGTAWTWPFPSYAEALKIVYGNRGIKKARSFLNSSFLLMNEDCINQLPEILDGDYPHQHKGCFAQAWSLTEFYRVANIIQLF